MMKTTHSRVLKAVKEGVRTWEELEKLTNLKSERLGVALSELFDLRKIWTAQRGGTRVYGMERRSGLAPRYPPPQRRSTDHT